MELMKKRISKYAKYYPEVDDDKITIAFKIPRSLKEKLEKILQKQSEHKKKVGWQRAFTAMILRFCDEELKR